jgi:hypothetical protein
MARGPPDVTSPPSASTPLGLKVSAVVVVGKKLSKRISFRKT